MTKLDGILKSRHYVANKGLSSQGYGFSSGHVWMWELDCEESWAPNDRCFWTVVLEKTLESPLDCKEIQPVHPERDPSWVFIRRTDAEAETPIFWPPHVKSWLIGKDPDAGRDWGQGGEGDDNGWDGCMESPAQCIWVWVNSRSWWWTGKPGMLRFMGLQRVGHDWATELNWTEFALIHGPNIPDSYAILLFTASDLASIPSHIHNRVLFLLWLHPFILSGVISPLISSNTFGTYQPGNLALEYRMKQGKG